MVRKEIKTKRLAGGKRVGDTRLAEGGNCVIGLGG